MPRPTDRVLAVDPGLGGGMAMLRSTGEIVLEKFTTESEFMDFVSVLGGGDKSSACYIEDVPAYVSAATSNASSFKLGVNFGFEMGVIRGLGVPLHLVGPKKWQKGLRGLKPNMGYTARKRCLVDNAKRLYPDLKVTNATADALLILNWSLARGGSLPR
jgi:hypothetical protein